MAAGLTLVCPIRGRLKATGRSKDGLTPTEERYRVQAIRYLIDRGYPRENFRVETVIKRFGSAGRNSFRADFVVLDRPVSESSSDDPEELLKHALILAEVKRDNVSASIAKGYQVRPMLDFAVRDDCVALYWDDVEQRVYWIVRRAGTKTLREGPLADLPGFGQKPGATRLTFDRIASDRPLLQVFKRVEDILHSASIGPSKRFTVMLQFLLAKLYDEHEHEHTPTAPLTIQDFKALDVPPEVAKTTCDKLLGKAAQYYQAFLPEPVSRKFAIDGNTLNDVLQVLAPIKIISMRQSVIQDFYMYFAKQVYKWDLAQYFTPTPLTNFVVDVLNPKFGEHIKDPACGSADFLTAAFRRGQHWPDYASSVWGSDVSPEAVQVAVLNMILNGDGKTNVREEDSLAKISGNLETCDVVICNPPFGARIVERNRTVLANFDLAHEWTTRSDGTWAPTERVLDSQESGILFAEACVKLLRPGGRMALILPNGYLGNRSQRYTVLREWLLRNCRFAAIVALPRFTFKSSGADVSASVVFCERRSSPLASASQTEDYELAVEVVDRVGWVTGDKRGAPVYRRDPMDGTYLFDEKGQLILDSDFDDILRRIRSSDAVEYFGWLVPDADGPQDSNTSSWTVPISSVVRDSHMTLDPKRLCRKFRELRSVIAAKPHYRLGDIVDFLPEKTSLAGEKIRIKADRIYRYVEIQDVETGSYRWQERPGWDLPQRARHFAESGDIYVGGIRNSVRKWFLVGNNTSGLVVTNGMHRLRMKPGCEDRVVDLVVGLCSELYRVQMRALARGADGLAEIAIDDVASVVLPDVADGAVREEMLPFIDQLLSGFTTVEAKVAALLAQKRLAFPEPPPRPDHTVLV